MSFLYDYAMRARIFIVAAVLACLGAGVSWYVWRWESGPPFLEVDFLSLERGHGVFIRSPDKRAILIDAGQSGDVVRALSGLLPFYRRTIDSVFMTRPEAKYVGGLSDVLRRYSVLHLYMPKGMGTSTASEAALSVARDKGIDIEELSAGGSVTFGGVSLGALFPDRGFTYSKASPVQLVLKLSYGSKSIVFVGDASKSIQNFLAKKMATSSIDILEYANSGSAQNVSEKFIRKLDPKHIVVKTPGRAAVSKGNRFSIRSYSSFVEDVFGSTAKFLSDGKDVWQQKTGSAGP